MHAVLFCHSVLSDWGHGRAHFHRGVVSELTERGHHVSVYEPAEAESVNRLVLEHGEGALALTAEHFPAVRPHRYERGTIDLDQALDGADVVIVHETTPRTLVRRIGTHRKRTRTRYTLLFHDTHTRAVTAPEQMEAFDLSGYDAILAFATPVKDAHVRAGHRAWVWREAADTRIFKPSPLSLGIERDSAPDSRRIAARGDLVWVGDGVDGERALDLVELAFDAVHELRLSAKVYGARWTAAAIEGLQARGVTYGGWLPNVYVPRAFAAHMMTVHVPRRAMARHLPGTPSMRVFEALACGIPLVIGNWNDAEGLFRTGTDHLVARDAAEMTSHMRMLLADGEARRELALRGRQSILARHTCAHRVDELLGILESNALESSPGSRPNVSLGVFL
jgi:spore maturation protein CgeB